MRELVDERERMADGWQEEIAAGLVGLGLDGDVELVAAIEDVLAAQVDRLGVTIERGGNVRGDTGGRGSVQQKKKKQQYYKQKDPNNKKF